MSIEEITNTITELENSKSTFDSCGKLASLYIVRDHLYPQETKQLSNDVITEYNDILPQYSIYCDMKRRYQMNEVSDIQVLTSMNIVCQEIKDFIGTLYTSSDMVEERSLISKTLADLLTEYTT